MTAIMKRLTEITKTGVYYMLRLSPMSRLNCKSVPMQTNYVSYLPV